MPTREAPPVPLPKCLRSAGEVAQRLEAAGASFEVVLPDGGVIRRGNGPPNFALKFRNRRGLRAAPNEYGLGRAYVAGDVDFEGDPMALLDTRPQLGMGPAVWQKVVFGTELFLCSPTAVNARAIGYHYTLGDDFYLTFIDRRYRFYSHCLFEHEGEALEDAAEHKLERMWAALDLRPGVHLLDIGGGWGGVTEYCSPRGVEVTALTLVDDSAAYIRKLMAQKGLHGNVLVGDFLEHRPVEPYDHAVIYGVIEHIPTYRRFCQRLWTALKPGARLYLDASATTQKYAVSPFTGLLTFPWVR